MHGLIYDEQIGSSSGTPSRKPLLLCFSHLRWDFVKQRPQHLMLRAAKVFDVVFVEEVAIEDDRACLRLFEKDGITIAVPHLPPSLSRDHLDQAVARLLTEFLCGKAERRVFWYYTPAAVEFSRELPRTLTVFDNMDELSAFRGASPDLLRLERELLANADLVFTGGWSLFEAKRDRHPAVHCFPSSVDAAHFGQARTGASPDPIDQCDLPRPRLGFFGVVDERMDLHFVDAFAALRPNWQFVMLGPVQKIDVETLPRRVNLHWLGLKTYAELPSYLAHWDLAFMPFVLNESTRFISPTKTPEFLAGGLRVLSTAVPDVVRAYGDDAEVVAIARTPEQAAAEAERLMREPAQNWLERVDAALGAQSWDRTWRDMLALVDQELTRDGAVRSPRAVSLKASA